MIRRVSLVALLHLLFAGGTFAIPALAEEFSGPKVEDSEEYYELYRLLVDSVDQIERNYVEEVDRREPRNFAVIAWYQIVIRVGWIFKTERIIMPAFLDYIGGSAWLRGCLPVLNRFGQMQQMMKKMGKMSKMMKTMGGALPGLMPGR